MTSSGRGDPLMGEVVDERYRIDALLGSGNTGRVYRARQLSVDRDVAVKVLRGSFRNDPQYRRRFLREAKVISGFNHPNIVRLIDFGEASGGEYSYLVMELVEGVELAALLQRGRVLPQLAFEVAYQAAAALIEAHNADIVHRDLKTQNILLLALSNGSVQVKVLDFGVAFPKDRRGERLTNAGQIFGTPAYMSPEQGEGKDVDAPADIYSLGIILFEMMTGELPFHDSSNLGTMMKHLEADRPLPSAHTEAALPEGTDQLVVDLMARSPQDRPPTASAVRERIDEIRDRSGWDRLRLDGSAPIENVFIPYLRDRADLDSSTDLRPLVPAYNEKSIEEAERQTEPTADAALSEVSESPEPSDAPRVEADPSMEVSDDVSTLETDTLENRDAFDEEESHPPMRAEAPDETTAERVPESSRSRGTSVSEDPVLRRGLIAVGLLLGLAGLLLATIYYVDPGGDDDATSIPPLDAGLAASGGVDVAGGGGQPTGGSREVGSSAEVGPSSDAGSSGDGERSGEVGSSGDGEAETDTVDTVATAEIDTAEDPEEDESGDRPDDEESEEGTGAPADNEESGRTPDRDDQLSDQESDQPGAESDSESNDQGSSEESAGSQQGEEVDESLEKSMKWLEGEDQ